MRTSTIVASALALWLPASSAALACDAIATECLPSVSTYPAYTPEGLRVGTVVARVRPPYPLEISRFTGQPRTVVFNNPDSLLGSIDPGFALVPLPRVPGFHTQAVFPRGY